MKALLIGDCKGCLSDYPELKYLCGMASGWPLFLVHSGNPPYLAFTLAQARFASPDNTIHLIGDDSNKNYKGVNHILAKELAGS